MTRAPAPLIWLFDVDGTLLLTKGAGREALALAFRDRFGIDDDLKSIPFAGRTDTLIVDDILAKHGVEFRNGERAQFWEGTAEHMRRLMDPPRGGLLPGVRELLDELATVLSWTRALLTGNVTPMAHVKLASFGIRDCFEWGAFGEEGADRNAIARLAVARATERHGVPPGRCIVVGDTEHDVACARAAGAHAVAVATGSQSREELREHAPDLLLDNLTDRTTLLAWARGL